MEGTVKGAILFEGSFSEGVEAEDLGVLAKPIRLICEKGHILNIQCGDEAKLLNQWMANLNDDRKYNLAHVCYGINQRARFSRLCAEDERVWGSTESGFGYQGPFFEGGAGEAVTNCEGICRNCSLCLEGRQIVDEGKIVEPNL